jgi:hypothetical protein
LINASKLCLRFSASFLAQMIIETGGKEDFTTIVLAKENLPKSNT